MSVGDIGKVIRTGDNLAKDAKARNIKDINIFEEVKKCICKIQPGVDETKIIPTASLRDDLEIDSLGMVELALALEEALGFYLPDEELEKINTVGDAISILEAKLKTKDA